MPGVAKEDIRVDVNTSQPGRPSLTVTASRCKELEVEDASRQWHIAESTFGYQTRSFIIPQNFDVEGLKVMAHQQGILSIFAPRRAGAPAAAPQRRLQW